MPNDLVSLFKDQFVTGVMTLLSVIAATLAAYFASEQLHQQRRRWFTEDARIGPTVKVLVGGELSVSEQGWFHGVWEVTNRAPFPLELLRIEARSPRRLIIGTLDPSTDGPVKGMRVGSFGKFLTIYRVVPVRSLPGVHGNIGNNFLFKFSSTPDKDRRQTIHLRFLLCEVDNPSHRYVRDGEAVIPIHTE